MTSSSSVPGVSSVTSPTPAWGPRRLPRRRHRAASITAPTLIADGAADQLDPAGNSRTLACLIPGARLTLFPGAGHAFPFQDQAALVTQVESFLA
jgi:pimeloyl-ACP methyl ester carboxylesterase